MKKIIVEGHRGYCAKYPENTLISYEAAMDLGVDAFEFDVWLTADKVPVLMHDESALRTCGVDVRLRDLTLAQVKELDACYEAKFGDTYKGKGIRVPTLEETLILAAKKRPDIWYGVEIKEYTEETVDLTVALLHQYGVFDRCYFYAFHGKILKYIKERYNGRTMGYPDVAMKVMIENGYDYYDEIGLSMKFVRSELCPFYVAKGMPVHMYCADTEEDVRLCIERGADLITANDPVPLLRVMRERGNRGRLTVRSSTNEDPDAIMPILDEARGTIAKLGIDQWQDGYPSRPVIAEDISLARSYVVERDGTVCGTFVLVEDGEPTYDRIFDGHWLTGDDSADYVAMHRVAVSVASRGSGVSTAMIDYACDFARGLGRASVRIDTHEGNVVMRRMLEKHGFAYCGIIYLQSGAARVAYEKLVK